RRRPSCTWRGRRSRTPTCPRGRSLARLFHRSFRRTQGGHCRLQGKFAFAERMATPFGFGIEVAQAAVLIALVIAGGRGWLLPMFFA
ncbi:MAG: hypothetical protein WCJ30_25330, partial [Deltaproteobacteria bacterium]